MIRAARFSDIPRMVEILAILHSRSVYAPTNCEIDEDLAKSLLMAGITATLNDSGFAQVSEDATTVQGFLIGATMPVYQIGTKLQATDVFWVATDDVKASEPVQLMRNFITWAQGRPDVIQVYCAATSAVQLPQKTRKLFDRLGFERSGEIHRLVL